MGLSAWRWKNKLQVQMGRLSTFWART
ncbi:MAG: hypothetical protein ACLT0Y_02485 [Christensenellales bacterium]